MPTQRRFTRQELLKQLQIINSATSEVISGTLPPSPPASRSASPAPPVTKRKVDDAALDSPSSKRARTEPGSRGSPESAAAAPTPLERRPPPTVAELRTRSNYFLHAGKTLKRSGDRRYQPKNPRETLVSLIEMFDAVLCFAYSFWLLDMASTQPHGTKPQSITSWQSMETLLGFARLRLQSALRGPPLDVGSGSPSERERARSLLHDRLTTLHSITFLLEGHIESLIHKGLAVNLPIPDDEATSRTSKSPPGQQPTPPAPSPAASIVSMDEVGKLRAALKAANKAESSMATAVEAPALQGSALARSFPRTWARALAPGLAGAPRLFGEDELATDLDTIGNVQTPLLWPLVPHAHAGRGIGAVCLFARALISEAAGDFGYGGVKAALPDPRQQ